MVINLPDLTTDEIMILLVLSHPILIGWVYSAIRLKYTLRILFLFGDVHGL